jgi:hypothetical protein
MFVRFFKPGTGDEYGDFDLPEIATSLKEGDLTISCKVITPCKNLGLYLTESSSLGRYRFQGDISSGRSLLAFNRDEEPEAGLKIKSSWTMSVSGNTVQEELPYKFFTIDQGSNYNNKIIIGPADTVLEEGFLITLTLSFGTSSTISVDKRIFVGIEAIADAV